MKLEFLYTDDSYKGKIHDIKLEDSVILSHTNKSGLFIFSYEVKGENKDSARILSNIKSQVEKLIDKEKCFLLNDGASEYYNKQLYPLYNWFERELRQVIAMAAVQDGKEKTKKLATIWKDWILEEYTKHYLQVRIFGKISKILNETNHCLKKI